MKLKRGEIFLREMSVEAPNTRKILACVPDAEFDFKPHKKSRSLAELCTHIAEIYGWAPLVVHTTELNIAEAYQPPIAKDNAELLAFFDKSVKGATEAFQKADDAVFFEEWFLRNGEQKFCTMTKIAHIRSMVMSHLIHHRGQLSVYLRLLDIPVPGMYGYSADDKLSMPNYISFKK